MTLVTIILTTLNSERYLVRSIESCLNQTYRDLELLIVDGGSTDRTLEIVAQYQQNDSRIRVIHQVDNAGKLPGAINLGMENAKGDYITWTQDDCWYELHAIETMLRYLGDHTDTALVYTDYWDVDEFGTRIRYQRADSPDLVFTHDVIRVSFLFHRRVYERIGPQEPRYFPVHEVPWRAAVARHFKIEALHVPLMSYVVHPQSLTGRVGGWDLERMTARALLDTGSIDEKTYRFRLSKVAIDQGYAELLFKGDFRAFRESFISGLCLDFSWVTNVGLWKLYFASFMPCRTKLRERLLLEWKQSIAREQCGLSAEAGSGLV